MPAGIKVMIAGCGIGGISLAIMLERAGIDYTIYERSDSLKPLGSAIMLTAQVLRVFDQLGLYEELVKVGKPAADLAYFNQKLERVGRPMDYKKFVKKFGYTGLFFVRADLMNFLYSKIPAEKVLWNKKVLSIEQNHEGVMIRCASGDTYHGDILVGADGAYSAVRQSMYKLMAAKGIAPAKSDASPLRFEQFALVGVTDDMSDEFPVLNEEMSTMRVVLASRKKSYNVYVIPVNGGRIGWGINGNCLNTQVNDQSNFRFSEWGNEAVHNLRKEINDIAIPVGKNVGHLLDHTKTTSFVMLEDRMFETWSHGRTVLIGDACHKVVPAGGQGGIQAILDAICLANLLYELPSNSPKDISITFDKYFEVRGKHARNAVDMSKGMNKLMTSQGFLAETLRNLALSMPPWVMESAIDRAYSGRPILNFLDPIPLKGTFKDTSKPMTLKSKGDTKKSNTADEPVAV
ncbi:hypothetical protein BGZ73_002238 [Actinomortierella ambigua]|nr:hypothetical protein BGZ73_002238 [Actinomortierella ambigua]